MAPATVAVSKLVSSNTLTLTHCTYLTCKDAYLNCEKGARHYPQEILIPLHPPLKIPTGFLKFQRK